MQKLFLISFMATGLAGVSSLPAFADYNCEVYIKREAQSNQTYAPFSAYSYDVPDFRTSGTTKFGDWSYANWIDFLPAGGLVVEAINNFPTRAQKCMDEAMKRTFTSDTRTMQIFDEILSAQPDLNAKTRFCTAAQAMTQGEGGNMEKGFRFKFKARKIMNRNNWAFEDLNVYPPKNYCASYYEPSCFAAEEAEETTAEHEELDGQAIQDLWDASEDTSPTATEDPGQVSTGSENAPPPPPPPTYCEPKPFTLLEAQKYISSQDGTGPWVESSSGTYGSIASYRFADFTGDGFDDYFNPENGVVKSLIPSADLKENCMGPSPRDDRPGGFGLNIPTPKYTAMCLPVGDRGGDLARFKIATLGAGKAQLLKVTGGQWSIFDSTTEGWTHSFPPSGTRFDYDDRAHIPRDVPTLPANPSAYKQALRVKAGQSDTLAFGDFFGDGHDDAFVIYDNKWWVSNDLTGPWIILADLNHLTSPLPEAVGNEATKSAVMAKPVTKMTDKVLANSRAKAELKKAAPTKASLNKAGKSVQMNHVALQSQGAPKAFGDAAQFAYNMHIADFTGDGTDDIFLIHAGKWYLFESGGSHFTVLRTGGGLVEKLKFGDFNGDGKMDVMEKSGSRLRYYASGRGEAINLQSSPHSLADIHPYRFGPDPKSNLFSIAPE